MSMPFNFLNKMKISNKLTIVYSAMVVLILLIFTFCAILAVYIFGHYQSQRVLTITATTVVNSINEKKDLFENNWDDITAGNDLYIVIYSQNGQILRLPNELTPDNDLIDDAELVIFGKVFRDGFFDDAAYINRSIVLDNEVYIVQVILDYKNELRMLIFMSVTLIILLILGAIFSVFVGKRMSTQMLKPIGQMTENANNIQLSGVSSERLTISRNQDEITDLGNTINAMLDRIENYSATLAQFVSDASHELRTPITVVLSYAEMLKKWAKDDPAALEKSIDSIEKEAIGMKILVDRLLTLAKSDTKNLTINTEEFELSELINEVVEETTYIADTREVELLQNDKLVLNSDVYRLKELLRIILDNAIKYTKKDGFIKISSIVEKGKLVISIRDNGIGIKKTELSRIFDRFFCSEISRNKKKSGSGLGLSIAKALATELGFSIEATSEEGEWTQFTLQKNLQ